MPTYGWHLKIYDLNKLSTDLSKEISSFVSVFIFMKIWNFMLKWAEHEKVL